MRCKKGFRGLALLLTLALTLAPAASAMEVEEARSNLKESYIDPIPDEVLGLPTIGEIIAALGDPYTYYMSPEQYAAFQADINDSQVVGIGVMVDLQATGLLITRVAPGSPAETAGLRMGDRIVSVQGTTIEAAGSPDALTDLIPGEVGAPVSLGYQRDGKTVEVTMRRAEVVFPVVTGALTDGHIGWINCYSFGEETAAKFREFVEGHNAEADRWVVDLRGNSGGLADAVIEMMSYSVGNRNVAYIADRNLDVTAWRLDPRPVEISPILTEPMIVLTNRESASASELYASAMRDYGAALLIGERTFGKGVGQELLEQPDGSALRMTTFRYYSPNWITPDKSGVLPHLVVEAEMAPRVARLLSGAVSTTPGVLGVSLAGWDWYVHKDAALKDKDAFAALLAALPADTPLTLQGKSIRPDALSKEWGVPFESRAFSDVDDSPYREKINHMATLGLLEGDGKGGFAPKDQLTRGQLCALLTNAMGYWTWQNERELPFSDVKESDWFYGPVKIMYELGLVSGLSDTEFGPNNPVTHQELLTILSRMGAMADLIVRDKLSKVDAVARSWPDVAKFAPWAQAAAATAKTLGYACRPLAELDPSAAVSREEAAATLFNLMRYMEIVFTAEDYTESLVDKAA